MPCYNAAATLAATINSILAQDVPLEVIVVDDGSTDTSLAIARSFESRVKVITGPNRGVSVTRNIGIAEGKSDWIVFVDADDLLEPGTIEKRLATATAAGADVVISDWRDIDESGKLTTGTDRAIDWSALQADAELATAVHVWATTAAILYRRTLIEKIGGFREDLPIIQDARLLFDAAYHGGKFAHSNHIGAKYRVTSASLSRRSPGRFYRDILLNGRQIEDLWRAKGHLDQERRDALFGIYNTAARGLFANADSQYFDAVAAQRKVAGRESRHSRVATPMARLVGLRTARTLLSAFHRV